MTHLPPPAWKTCKNRCKDVKILYKTYAVLKGKLLFNKSWGVLSLVNNRAYSKPYLLRCSSINLFIISFPLLFHSIDQWLHIVCV